MVVIVRTVHGSTVEQLCRIVHRPQCRTVHQTLVYPASSIQGVGQTRSITELMRWRSDALVKPRHALAAYVRRATTVARYIDVLQSRSVQSVAAQHSQRSTSRVAERAE